MNAAIARNHGDSTLTMVWVAVTILWAAAFGNILKEYVKTMA